MNVNMVYPPRPSRRGRVIALHCSGGGAGQWSYLAEGLGGRYEVLAPEHYGCESLGPWTGEHAFTLSDEAAQAIALIDRSDDQVHLVGHSYGGGVALNVALARPDRIASMALYEPSAFYVLRQMGERGATPFEEIAGVAGRFSQGVVTGDYRGAVAAFVDYWSGPGSWSALRPSVQRSLVRWAPKGPLDFRALMDDPTPVAAYQALTFPVLILRGEHAPSPTRVISEGLVQWLPERRLVDITGAGHMGPLTHAPQVSALIVRHIVEAEAAAPPRNRGQRRRTDIALGSSRGAEAVS